MNSRQADTAMVFCALLRATKEKTTDNKPQYLPIRERKVLRLVLLLLQTRLQREYYTEGREDPAAAANQITIPFFSPPRVSCVTQLQRSLARPHGCRGGGKRERGSVRNPCRRPEPQDNKVNPHRRTFDGSGISSWFRVLCWFSPVRFRYLCRAAPVSIIARLPSVWGRLKY